MTESYKPTDWQNMIVDEDGTVVQKGTPLSAENLNKIERKLVSLDMDQHNHPNKEILDGITQQQLDKIGENATLLTEHEEKLVLLMSSITNLKVKAVQTIAERDTFENKEGIFHVINATGDPTVKSGWAQYIYQTDKWIKIAENESLDVILTWASITGKPTTFKPSEHGHSIEQITKLREELDTKLNKSGGTIDGILTLGNTELTADTLELDGVTSVAMRVKNDNGYISISPNNTGFAHIYTDRARFAFNKTVMSTVNSFSSYNNDLLLQRSYVTYLTLGAALASFITPVQAPSFVQTDGKKIETTAGAQTKVDTHAGDMVIHITKEERTKWNEASTEIQTHQTQLTELAKHTHDYKDLLNKPVLPSKTSELTNDSSFIQSNAARITVSKTAPTNPSPNDIWIVI